MPERAFVGTALHTPERGRLEVLRDKVWLVGADGTIKSVLARGTPDGEAVIERHRESATLQVLEEGRYWLPGMVDLHVHAPQWPQLGLALDEPLEIWLQKFTFPLEARYASLRLRRRFMSLSCQHCWPTARRRRCITPAFIYRRPRSSRTFVCGVRSAH